jgi:hypothetical protein
MPPAFLVDKYKVNNIMQYKGTSESKEYKYESINTVAEVLTDINPDLHSRLRQGWKINEPEYARYYLAWPVRFSFTCKSSRENDRRLKLLKWKVYYEELVKLFGYHWRSDALPLAHKWVSDARRNLAYDDWTYKYVAHHQESHPVRGISWGQLLKYNKMNILFNYTKEFVEWWDDHFEDLGDWSLSQMTVSFGIRARSPTVKFIPWQKFILDRGRQIGFNPGPSTINAFNKHDNTVKFMRKQVFDFYEGELGCRIISPKTEGGQIYTILRDAFLDGKKLTNYDVSGMELITPSILAGNLQKLPPGVGCCTSYLGEIPELLSGVGPTSDYDIIAHLELLTRIIEKTPEIICILGDDNTMVGGQIKQTPLYERQDGDERIHRTLGLTTTKYVHPVGRHFTIDNAQQSLQVIPDQWIKNKLTLAQRESILDLFLGNVNGTPLSELIGKIAPQPFVYSPKELLYEGLNIPIGV